MKFHNILHYLMNDKGIDLKTLSLKADISLSSLYGILELGNLPTFEILIKLCNHFDCSVDYILGFSESVEKSTIYRIDKFVENYKRLLIERKTNNHKVCRDLGMSRNRYYDWQKGKLPYVSTLITLANYFKISVDELIG